MSQWLQHLFGQASALKQALGLAQDAKAVFIGFSALLALTTNKFVAPFQDDMPFPFKLILVALTASTAAVLPTLGLDRVALVLWLLGTGVAAFLVYLGCYGVWGYTKVVEVPARFFRAAGYKEVRILGGLWLRPGAKAHTNGEASRIQVFLADNAYNQDVLWSRPSRLPVQAAAILSYSIAAVALTGVLWAIAIG